MKTITKAAKQRSASAEATRRKNLAFNQGCDAALAGAAKSSCPYRLGSALAAIWQSGWKDADSSRRLGRV